MGNGDGHGPTREPVGSLRLLLIRLSAGIKISYACIDRNDPIWSKPH